MNKNLLIIPTMNFMAIATILLDIPYARQIIVFAFLTTIPGYAALRLFGLKEISSLETILLSVGLSIILSMFLGLLINQIFLSLGILQPLSELPLTIAISAFTLSAFGIAVKRKYTEDWKFLISVKSLKNTVPVSLLIILLPIFSIIGVLYANTSLILLSYIMIGILCVTGAVFRKSLPSASIPFIIFSISIALVLQLPLTSKYILGYDSNLEYYVSRITQINEYWVSLDSNVNPLVAQAYNSMLSITVLPNVYSALMQTQGELVFKSLYPFIFSLVPLALFQICQKQFGKSIGFLSALFFVFTSSAFYSEPLSLNRQIMGEFFLVLSIFLLLNNAIPGTKARLLLIIFGAAIAVSHYSIAYIYLAMITTVFIVSRIKPKFKGTLNPLTFLLIIGIILFWFTITNAPLAAFSNAIQGVITAISTGAITTVGTASSLIFIPRVFTIATWINLLLSGIAYIFLIAGALLVLLRPKKTGINQIFSIIVTIAASILVITFVIPSVAATLNFVRYYGILLLFLSPCFVLGGQAIITIIGQKSKKYNRSIKRQIIWKHAKVDLVIILIAIIAGAYFLSQVGFVNNVTDSAIHSYTLDFNRSKNSTDPQILVNFYTVYTPEQDVFSASWLLNNKGSPWLIYSDYVSGAHVLTSYGLTPWKILEQLTNSTEPLSNTYVYMSRLNIAENLMTTYTNYFNTSQVYQNLSNCSLVYSNGNGEILSPAT